MGEAQLAELLGVFGFSLELLWTSVKLLCDGAGERRSLVPGVLGGDGFDERDPGLLGCRGVVANAAGDDEELARTEKEVATIGRGAADAQFTAEYEEHFVLKGMRVPRELPMDTRYLDVLIIDLTDHSRRPELRERAAREF
jgi:hypothetical protein